MSQIKESVADGSAFPYVHKLQACLWYSRRVTIPKFKQKIWDFYAKEGRNSLPWRKTHDPYKILVSEMMLQQTQVDRVIPKYQAFLKRFPNVQALASAPLSDVLALWSGLGYNRRALFLKRAAEAVVAERGGKFPIDAESLEELPGVGPYTAKAVATFAYSQTYTFIETNIRAVFIHEFFPDAHDVKDDQLVPLIAKSVDRERSREWYYALMDYGSYLKKTGANPSRKSAHHTVQSAFKGSLREIRGGILRKYAESTQKAFTREELLAVYGGDASRFAKALDGLVKDGFLGFDTKGRVIITA